MTSPHFALVAVLAIAAAGACSSKQEDHPPISTDGANGNSGGGGGSGGGDAGQDTGADSATGDDGGTDADASACTHLTCSGCCDPLTSACLPGNTADACGINGDGCRACSQTGLMCVSAQCQ